MTRVRDSPLFDYTRVVIEKDTLVRDTTLYVVERTFFGTSREPYSRRHTYEAVSGGNRLVYSPGEDRIDNREPFFDAPFQSCYDFGEFDFIAVRGSYGGSIQVSDDPPQQVEATKEHEFFFPGSSIALGVRYAYGIGEYFSAVEDAFTYLMYARIADREYGTPLNLKTSIHERKVSLLRQPLASYPNPFRHSTTLQFSLAEAGSVTIEIFDISGRHVDTPLTYQFLRPGEVRISWDASSLAVGLYFARLKINGKAESIQPIVLLR